MDEQLEQLVSEVLSSSKYAHIVPGLVARIGAAELDKGRKLKDAVKATKNKLHQVGGAYQKIAPNYAGWLAELSSTTHDQAQFKAACRAIMSNHASTYERLPILDQFYAQIFSLLPPVHTVLDVACGLNPMALPWMNLAPAATYRACDMYADMIDFVAKFMNLLPVHGQAEVCDVAACLPDRPVDLALVLKTIPCLEQIDKQAGKRLLDGLNAHHMVLSFPAKSLGGRSKGMLENYQVRFEELTADRGWKLMAKLEFVTELVFVVKP